MLSKMKLEMIEFIIQVLCLDFLAILDKKELKFLCPYFYGV